MVSVTGEVVKLSVLLVVSPKLEPEPVRTLVPFESIALVVEPLPAIR